MASAGRKGRTKAATASGGVKKTASRNVVADQDDPQPQGSAESAAATCHHRIQELAYFKAQSRNFAPGLELQDWLEAEQEVTVQPGLQTK